MEKEKRITAPDGCEIEKVELVDGVVVVTFKEKKQKLPKSWEEFCSLFPMKLPSNFSIKKQDSDDFDYSSYNNRLIEEMVKFTGNRDTAEAVLALCQLIQLRDCYNGDWEPDWNDISVKYTIEFEEDDIITNYSKTFPQNLYFKTEELRDKFLRNFRPLIEKLEPLYGIKEGGEE